MRKYIITTLFLSSCVFCQAAEQQAGQDKPAYDSSKDVGLQAPANADILFDGTQQSICLLYTSPSPRDYAASRMPSSA